MARSVFPESTASDAMGIENHQTCDLSLFLGSAEGRHLVSTIYNGVPDGLGARKVAKGPVVTIGHVAAHKNPATWIRATGYVIGRAATPPDFI